MKAAYTFLILTILLGSTLGIAAASSGRDTNIAGYMNLVKSSEGKPKLGHYTSVLTQANSEKSELKSFITSYAVPEVCFFGPGIVCQDWQLKEGKLTLVLYNAFVDMTITGLDVNGEFSCDSFEGSTYLRMSQTTNISMQNCNSAGSAELSLTYKKGFAGFEHKLKGTILIKE